MSKDKLFIWDIDGTLMSCGNIGKISLNEMFKKIYNIENAFNNINMAGQVDLYVLKKVLKHYKIRDYDLNELFHVYGIFLKNNLKKDLNKRVLPNVEKNLQIMKNDNKIYSVIGTGNSEIGSIIKLKSLKLDRWFSLGSYGSNHNNRESLVKNAISISKYYYDVDFCLDNIYMIGDTPADIISGQKNRIKTIALATGSYSYFDLKEYNPSFLFKKMPDNLLKNIK